MPHFTPSHTPLATWVQRLQERSPLPPLMPSKPWRPWSTELAAWIEAASAEALVGSTSADPAAVEAVRAGLFLWNDQLDACHTIVQGLENPTGSYWHTIMHRREGDLSNSGYWFRRTGAHPAQADVLVAARALVDAHARRGAAWATPYREQLDACSAWDPFLFLDWCAAPKNEVRPVLEAIQVAEIELLLAHCHQQARRGAE